MRLVINVNIMLYYEVRMKRVGSGFVYSAMELASVIITVVEWHRCDPSAT